MKSSANADLLQTLRALRRRMLATLFLEKLAASALIVAAALVVFGALNRWIFNDRPAPADIVLGALIAVGALASLGTFANRCSLTRVASIIDELGQTRDRFVTALALSAKAEPPGQMHALAVAECSEFVRRADFCKLVSVRPPRAVAWLAVPFVALGLLHWDFRLATERRLAEAASAQREIGGTIRQLEQLALQTAKATDQSNSAELRGLAEQLRRSAERLRAETSAADAQKAALRELSALEQALQETLRHPSTSEEMKELAKALAPVPGMKEVLSALDENNLAAAAKALEAAEKQAGEGAAQPTEEQVKQALEKAVERLAQQRQLSAALQKLGEQLRQQSGSQTRSAMQQLREMIQQAQQAGAPAGEKGGQPMTIEQLIAALQNMKFGEGQPGGTMDGQQSGDPRIVMEAFGAAGLKGDPQSSAGKVPSGQPGTEKDFGTSDDPFGSESEPADKGADLALKGRLADGESLSTMLPAAGEKSRASRRYQELYEAMAPAAENAVQQENIPLGSRFYIKRYFESIRPAE